MAEQPPLPPRGTRAPRLWLLPIYAFVAVLIASPLLTQWTLEGLGFDDRLGTLPVHVGVAHNGYSSVDTGALGSIYLERTGRWGFGVAVEVTGPPDAGGSLASYVDPAFVQANTSTLTSLDRTAAAYADRLGAQFRQGFAWRVLGVGTLGGLALTAWAHPGLVRLGPRRRVVVAAAAGISLAGASTGLALWQHQRWEGSAEPTELFAMADPSWVSFDSAPAREIAVQVSPFIEKNLTRLRDEADDYVDRATSSIRTGVAVDALTLTPRSGEQITVAEADPQGSRVGTRVRRVLYAELASVVGDAVVARSISGDITSNGTVAERVFVQDEVAASPDMAVVAVKGDHDSGETVGQLTGAGAEVVDGGVVEVGDLRFAGAADPEFKSLFGGSITNPSGVSPEERGAQLRERIEGDGAGESVHVLAHQNDMALGFLGLTGMAQLRSLAGPGSDYTRPVEDGIADLPPGSLSYGHWHEGDGPWVIWNTDGAGDPTWTLVDQLGTSGGVEERPTFNRFSTPVSPPLKPIEVRLHYLDDESGLVTGFVTLELTLEGDFRVSPRTDVGIPLSR